MLPIPWKSGQIGGWGRPGSAIDLPTGSKEEGMKWMEDMKAKFESL